MKKMNNKGFMLAETLVVATFLVTTLLFIYVQFNNVTNSYDTSFRYNTVNGLYATKNIVDFVKSDGLDNLKTSINANGYYIDITNCSTAYFEEADYCQILFDTLKVKTVLFTKENLTELKNNTLGLTQTMIDFINYIDYDTVNDYRIIVEFEDNTLSI